MTAVPAAKKRSGDLLGKRFGRYEVLAQIASGGMATVYVARAVGVAGFERLVALKVLHPHLAHEEEFLAMFLDEARLAARIRHPNVVPTLDINDSGGDGYYLVMDYVEGDHLGGLLQRATKTGERIEPSVVARVVLDALAGLAAAHRLTDERGQPLLLVHRDISPHNLLVGVDGIARLTDFGVAKAEVRLSSTREGQFKGKLAYMAPEQASTGQTDQRSDIFSMGVVLWESLSSRRLFRGSNNAETLNKILKEPIPRLSSAVPDLASFDEVLLRALARDPQERFQSADEFAEALEQVASASVGVASARSVGETVRRIAAEKLRDEQQRIRAAIDRLGHFELEPGSLPRPTDSSHPSQPQRPGLDGTEPTLAATPSARQAEGSGIGPPAQPLSPPNRARWAVPVLLLLLLGGAGLWWLSRPDPTPEATAPPGGPERAAAPRGPEPTAVTPSEAPPAAPRSPEPAPAAQEPSPAAERPEPARPLQDEQVRRTRRARRRATGRTRSRTRRQQASNGPEQQPEAAPRPKREAPPEDDLLLNPYRR